MKNILLAICLISTMNSCGTPQPKEDSIRETEETSEVQEIPKQIDNCDINAFLNDPDIALEAKAIWKNENYSLEQVYKVIDIMFESNDDHRPFYFVVATKALRNHDGELTEIVSKKAYDFIFKSHTEFFFNFFNEPHCLTKDNPTYYNSWAELAGYYVSGSCDTSGAFDEKKYNKCIEDKLAELKAFCKSCKVDNFINRMKSEL